MRPLTIATLLLFISLSLPAAEDGPRLSHVCAVAADILSVSIDCGQVVCGKLEPNRKQAGDVVQKYNTRDAWLNRGGKIVGGLVGPGATQLKHFDRLAGAMLESVWLDAEKTITLGSEDPNFKRGHPLAVHRKSRPIDMAWTGAWEFKFSMRHTLFLRLPTTLVSGKKYTLSFAGKRLADAVYLHTPNKTRSDAVHVSQIGFRPDDPVKTAFLSVWLGTGGAHQYAEALVFKILDDKDGRSVFEGKTKLSKAVGAKDEDPYKKDYNLTSVYSMDFSSLKSPGKYRVYVEGLGCSYPFEIAEDVWKKAFAISAKSLYHQRSGIAIGPPWTDFKRPRAFHPDDGMKIYQSTCSLLDSGNGLNAKGTDKDNFGNLVAGKTDELVPNAWGGYFDAGDWDRRIQHLEATRLHLELVELYPEFTQSIELKIPESGNGLPDLVNEAMWNIDFYKRLQTKAGGIRGGIESAEHPRFGEASWLESLPVMAYAPDPWSSFIYAGDTARLVGQLKTFKPALVKNYLDSALKAMEWGEAEYLKLKGQKLPHQVADARNLAAAELFRLTGEKKWHSLFLETTVFKDAAKDIALWQSHDQRDAAFVYVRTKQPGMLEEVRRNALNALIREADVSVAFGHNTAFKWTKLTPWGPFGFGTPAVPAATTLLRVYALSGQEKYLRAAVLACQFSAGANPLNICYTTGVGTVSPLYPTVVDQRMSGQSPPPGITVLGPRHHEMQPEYFCDKLIAPVLHPALKDWPAVESYFDLWLSPMLNEFSVMQNLGPNAYVWGHLAARPKL